MAGTELVLTGDKELLAQFGRMERALRGQMLMRALVSGALLFVNRAKEIVHKITGNLARSLRVGNETSGDDWAEVSFGTNVEYAAREEFGFAGADSLGRVYNQPAHPYLRPAIASEKFAVVHEIAAAVNALIRAAR
jgi:HK97 gp10 family phage protein